MGEYINIARHKRSAFVGSVSSTWMYIVLRGDGPNPMLYASFLGLD